MMVKKEPPPLGHVADAGRDRAVQAEEEGRQTQVQREGEPDRYGQRVGAGVTADQRSGLGRGAVGAAVEPDQDRPQANVGQRETRRVLAVPDVGDEDGQGRDRHHPGEEGQPQDQVVGVEAIGVEAEALPGDVDWDEEPAESGEPRQAVIHD
jgi:hypothetical protein